MKSLFLSCYFLLTLSLDCFGQSEHFKCKQTDPSTESVKKIKQLLNHSAKSTDLKIIPVVFHVLHQNGVENISDVQILDAMQILNNDFKKLSADTIDVVSPFDTIIGKVNFEFRLATIDPDGNPTTGIDRILTPLTNAANDNSKINSWDPQKYVNIWVVRTIGFAGISGYTYNPLSAVPDACTDGIVMLHNYVGSIGTGAPFMRYFLTHEMGHFFGLFHPHEEMLATPNIWCDYTDGIYDTPRQIGNFSCNLTANSCNDSLYAESFDYWGFDVPDMTQNFMNNSFCMSLFTNAQAAVMRGVIESPLYGRDQLWTTSNLIATGTGPGAAPVSEALPDAGFSIQNTNFSGNIPNLYGMICAVGDIQFISQNGSPAGTTYSWSFPGGVPSSSTLPNPTVNYATHGYYDVTLTVTNANGSATTSRSAMIYVSASWPEFVGPTVQDFDLSADFWQIHNSDNTSGSFQRIPNHGTQNTGCFFLENQYNPDTTVACYASSPQQINSRKDYLISPAFDLSNSTNVSVSFDYAYGSAADPDSAYEAIKIYSSRDCGRTWITRYTVTYTALVTAFAAQGSDFVPAPNQWKQVSFPYTTAETDKRTRFKIEFSAANHSNNLYIDNFMIDGILGISDNALSGISIYPNPSKSGGSVTISGLNASEANGCIYDLQGKVVYEQVLSSTDGNATLESHLKAGCYLVEVSQNGSKFLTRLVVE